MKDFYTSICEEITVVLCTTQNLLNKAKRIRYDVFCVENGYESENITKLEQDRFDDQSHHLLAIEKSTGEAVATMRLIISKELPLHAYVSENHILKKTILSSGKTAEFSRLAVMKNYRSSFIAKASAALFLASGYLAVKLGYSTVGGIMQKQLLRIISRIGVKCTRITEDFEHRGIRAVYVMTCYEFISHWSGYTSFETKNIDSHYHKLCDFSGLFNEDLICNTIHVKFRNKTQTIGLVQSVN